MTNESPTDVAIRYVGQQVETLRASLHDELAAVRTDLSVLAGELRTNVPRIAVLEHRVSECEKDVAVMHAERGAERVERERERAADRRHRIQMVITVVVCVLGTVLAWLVRLGG